MSLTTWLSTQSLAAKAGISLLIGILLWAALRFAIHKVNKQNQFIKEHGHKLSLDEQLNSEAKEAGII